MTFPPGTREGVTFSELHGSNYADVDVMASPISLSANDTSRNLDTNIDPYPRGPAVLYWYQTVRNPHAPGGAEFVPHLIDNHSGAGSNVLAVDLNTMGDGHRHRHALWHLYLLGQAEIERKDGHGSRAGQIADRN